MEYKIVSDNGTLDEYLEYYFKKYPRRQKKPIEHPWHPSINEWFILMRPAMNELKQKWKEYIVWLVDKHGYKNLKIDNCEITYKFFMPSLRRADTDNFSPKFVQDGLTMAGVVIDDDYTHVNPLHIELGYDKENPRMEIIIKLKAI
jgi:Holliday junction resolvase RusA-like endonuclease